MALHTHAERSVFEHAKGLCVFMCTVYTCVHTILFLQLIALPIPYFVHLPECDQEIQISFNPPQDM